MSELTPTRLSGLRRIAEQATPGPWEWGKYLWLYSHHDGSVVLGRPEYDDPDVVDAKLEDSNYIEAMHPRTVLALSDEIERLCKWEA